MGESFLGEKLPMWFRMSATYYLDDKVLKVSGPAEMYFSRLLGLAHQMQSDGWITAIQLRHVGHKLRSYSAVTDELIAVGLLNPRNDQGDVQIARWSKWQGRGANGSSSGDVSAGSSDGGGSSLARTRARPRARTGQEENRREVEVRTASPDVRTSTTAAPHRAEGAAPPSEEDQVRPTRRLPDPDEEDQNDGVTLSAEDAKAAIRRKIQEAQRTVSGSQGRDIYLGRPEWKNLKENQEREARGESPKGDPSRLIEMLSTLYPPPMPNGNGDAE